MDQTTQGCASINPVDTVPHLAGESPPKLLGVNTHLQAKPSGKKSILQTSLSAIVA